MDPRLRGDDDQKYEYAVGYHQNRDRTQLRKGLPVFKLWTTRSCVFAFLSRRMNSRRSKVRNHFSSTTLPDSSSPPQSTRAIASPISKSYPETNPPSRILTSIISRVAMPVLPATGMLRAGSGGRYALSESACTCAFA